MPYTKVHDAWEDLPSTVTPINAAALDQIEAGIADAQDDADSANTSIGDHLADTSAAHAASAVSFSPTGTVGAANVQSAIAEVASDAAADVTAHTGDSSGAHAASAISVTPAGSISSSNVQAALVEIAASVAGGILPDGDYGDVTVSGGGTVITIDAGAVSAAKVAADVATQAELDAVAAAKADDSAVVHDTGAETIAGVKTFSSDPIIPDEAYDATNWNGVLEPPTKNAVRDEMENRVAKATFPCVLVIAIGDEATAITTGTAKTTFRMPHAMTLTAVRASLTTASSSGTPTFDINEGGTTILSTKLTIDANELTSTTAATAAVISDAALADDAEITIDIDTAGTGAKGPKIYLIGTRSV